MCYPYTEFLIQQPAPPQYSINKNILSKEIKIFTQFRMETYLPIESIELSISSCSQSRADIYLMDFSYSLEEETILAKNVTAEKIISVNEDDHLRNMTILVKYSSNINRFYFSNFHRSFTIPTNTYTSETYFYNVIFAANVQFFNDVTFYGSVEIYEYVMVSFHGTATFYGGLINKGTILGESLEFKSYTLEYVFPLYIESLATQLNYFEIFQGNRCTFF